MEASNLVTLSKRIIILLHVVHGMPRWHQRMGTDTIARHVNFAQSTCQNK